MTDLLVPERNPDPARRQAYFDTAWAEKAIVLAHITEKFLNPDAPTRTRYRRSAPKPVPDMMSGMIPCRFCYTATHGYVEGEDPRPLLEGGDTLRVVPCCRECYAALVQDPGARDPVVVIVTFGPSLSTGLVVRATNVWQGEKYLGAVFQDRKTWDAVSGTRVRISDAFLLERKAIRALVQYWEEHPDG